jgi:carbonic anhydrase
MSVTDELLRNAEEYAANFDKGDLPLPPGRKVAVLACMDARLNPYGLLGLQEGDAHVIRNAGGVVTDDEIRSLAISQRLLGTEEIVVVMHEGCGLCGASEDDFAAELAADGVLPSWRIGAFDDLEATLRASLERLRSSPELKVRDRV